MKCKVAKVIKVSKKQIGKSNQKRDKARKALKPGKRLSRNKKVYTERRTNRSDIKKGLLKRKFCEKK